MAKRKGLSPKTRFEVFKRDKFICQYCGSTLPGSTLEVDHIKPVSKGGTNELLNLVTSCWDCNRGKTDKTLDDNSAITKKKNQLNLLQENREQMEMMLEWSDGLQEIDSVRNQELVKRINAKMHPRFVSEDFEKRFANITKKHILHDVLKAIEIASNKYLQFDVDGNVTKESAENFVKKIGGVLHNLNIPAIQQKANYIKGICKNRFTFWDPRKGSILLNNYIKSLKDNNYNEEQIINNLDKELIPRAKEAKNWTEWNKLLESWISSNNEEEEEDYSWEERVNSTQFFISQRKILIQSLNYLGKSFEGFNKEELEKNVDALTLDYLYYLIKNPEDDDNSFLSSDGFIRIFDTSFNTPKDNNLHNNDAIKHLIRSSFIYFYNGLKNSTFLTIDYDFIYLCYSTCFCDYLQDTISKLYNESLSYEDDYIDRASIAIIELYRWCTTGDTRKKDEDMVKAIINS